AASDTGGIAKLPKPDRRMLDIAEKIIEQQEGKFDPSTFKDRYEDAVRDLIARKKRGQKVTTAPPVEKDEGTVVDLMDALRRSLAGQGGGSKERAERFLERKKGKAGAKARPYTKKRAA
ncbi:MAG: putative ATP-dependent ligase protein, partial [Deltaproteobacteria bacterium]|nr:putative ATP-dependent ligase protein [Deltaproteobacteria bacterium]